MAESEKSSEPVSTTSTAIPPAAAPSGPPRVVPLPEDAPAPPRRSPGHRGADVKDTVAEMAAKAHEISLEAGSKMAAAMKDVVNAAAGLSGFVMESARDLVQFMVRRGQMTQDEADKLITQVEEHQPKRKPVAPSTPPSASKPAAAAEKTPAVSAPPARPADKPAPAKPARAKSAAPAKPAPSTTVPPKPAVKKASASSKPAPKAAAKPAKPAGRPAPKKPAPKAVKPAAKKTVAKKAPAKKAAAKKPAAKPAKGKRR